ncbi:MAG: methyltransferase domain-containing protein [Thermoplasmata archaeon]
MRESSSNPPPAVRIIHFADPWCWWSWGLEPVLRRLKEVYGDRLEIVYRMGGVFEDIDAWRKEYGVDEESTVDWVRDSAAMAKMSLDPEYLRRTGVRSTYPACLAFKAAERQDPHKAERYFRRLMEAFQVHARALAEEELANLAEEVGINGKRLLRDMASSEVEEAFEDDRKEMKSSGANFLSLIIEAGGERVVKGDIFTSTPFEEEIDRLAPGLPKRSPVDILEYLEKMQGHLVAAHEIAEVFHIAEEDAEERLRKLEEAGFLDARRFEFATYWIPKTVQPEKLPLDVVKISHVPPEAHVETTADLTPVVTSAVQSLYTEVATRPDKEYHFPLGHEAVEYVGYPKEDIAKLPPTAVESFAGVGYPFAAEVIRPGDTVLDIGSGSGTDVLYASLKVGPQGKVYGLDFTAAMIEKARSNIVRMGATNVEILEGDATGIPLPNASVDVVTSNGVLNLVPDKAAAFKEILRVLRPGGSLQLADIVVQEDVGAVCGLNPQLWADCIGGAAVEAEYHQTIKDAGFADLRVLRRLDYFAKSSSDSTRRITKTFGAESITLAARKP